MSQSHSPVSNHGVEKKKRNMYMWDILNFLSIECQYL